MVKPILRWPGGKSKHLKRLLPLISPHVCYVEPFAGGLALLLAKERSDVEIVNDSNRDLIALYRCVQWHPEALCAEIEWCLSARVNIADFRENRGLTDLQRAARFLVLNKTSFAGSMTSFAVQKTSGGGAAFSRARLADLMKALNARLDKVVVECLDWMRCVDLYDSENTLFFLDPPYLGSTIRAYAGWTEEQMTALRDVLRRLKGRWILTVDASKFCHSLFSEWNCRTVETPNKAVNLRTHGHVTMRELIITPA